VVRGTALGRDTVPALLAPGEGVLSRKAVSLIGVDAVNAMNDGLVRRTSNMGTVSQQREPDTVNVYVVDRGERPQLGPRDILAVIGEDILTGGSTKQLIKQVAVGGM
jgi:hypothetical protein